MPVFPCSDKVFHLLIYVILGSLFYRAFGRMKGHGRITVVLAVSASVLYGISDEIHQSFIPDRTAEMLDILADTIGSFLGVIIFHRIIRNQNKLAHLLT